MRADQRVGDLREFGHVGTHLGGAERAIEADGERLAMLDGVPEGFRRLSRQHATRKIGDGAGNPDRQMHAFIVERFLDGEDRGLRVQRVEDSLDHDEIGAAPDERTRRHAVGLAQFVERDVAESRIVYVRRQRRGAVRRPEHARHEARVVVRFRFIAERACQPRTFLVQLFDQMLETVIGLADRRGIEGIRLDDVGAGFEIGAADLTDDVRLRQRQKIVVALELVTVIAETATAERRLVQRITLDHHAPGSVEDEDALARRLLQPRDARIAVETHETPFRSAGRPNNLHAA